uniref:CSON002605 protein n=1 Tax=Culicoides sonorensis TaxID=179676 RepID=A0A336MXA7_CULSO
MLGLTKWRLLTIVAGILLAQAIESPNNEYSNSLIGSSLSSSNSKISSSIDSQQQQQHQETASFVNAQLGLKLEEFGLSGADQDIPAVPVISRQSAKNLLPPYQKFSIVDNIRYVDSKTRNSRGMPETFGSFRIINNNKSIADDISNLNDNSDDLVQRRFDSSFSSSSEMPYQFNQNDNNNNNTLNSLQHNYYIPNKTGNRDKNININNNMQLTTTNPFIQQINDDIIGQIQSESNYNNNNNHHNNNNRTSPLSSTTSTSTSQTTFNDESDLGDYDYVEPSARRSGFRFPSDARNSKFVPQGYSEDNPGFAETLSNQHRPFLDEHLMNQDSLKDHNEPAKLAELLGRNRFNAAVLGTDDPILAEASSNHQIRILPGIVPDSLAQESDLNQNVQRQSIRTYPTIYYQGDFRPSRHYFPPKIYTEAQDFSQVIAAASAKSKFPPVSTWKSRTPRVIFPIPDGISSGAGIASSPYSNDNIVFRDQNFGINDLQAVQDVRNDFDVGDSPEESAPAPSKDKGRLK